MNSSVSIFSITFQRVAASWPWYIVRGAGFVAALLIILLMLSGIGLVTGHTYKLFEPSKAWVIHRALGIALCVSIAVHVLFLLIDHTLPFTLAGLLIPFYSGYKTLWVALGVLAMYGTGLVVATSLGWIDTKKDLWKKTHFVSYAVMFFVFFHALNTGTDLVYGTFRAAWISVGFLIGLGVIMRLYRTGTLKKQADLQVKGH